MKAISLWQPWAALVAVGAKQYETRSWSTSYRGPLAIHATKSMPRAAFDQAMSDKEFVNGWTLVRRCCPPHADVLFQARGAVVAIVQLVDVCRVEAIEVDERELLYGNFTPGRYAWKLEDVRVFRQPVPARGAQGLWNWRNDA